MLSLVLEPWGERDWDSCAPTRQARDCLPSLVNLYYAQTCRAQANLVCTKDLGKGPLQETEPVLPVRV